MRHPTGISHPKNVFLLLEDKKADESGYHARSLVIGALSANLTRSGWWENVEAAHFEQIYEGEKTLLREDLRGLFRQLKIRAHSESSHVAIDLLQSFLKDIEARSLRSTSGLLHSRFFTGREAFTDFLDEAAGDRLRGAYLEIISPYFDDVAECKPLEALIERFAPRPFASSFQGHAAVRPQSTRNSSIQIERAEVEWARLPEGLLRLGKTKDSANRIVHAKIYRFFTQKPKRELCFVGSVNLTSSAHQHGGNWETGLLVDCDCHRTPDFWLIADVTRPKVFVGSSQTDPAATGGTPLTLRYFWDTHVAKAFWDAPSSSPRLKLESRGIAVGELALCLRLRGQKISDEIASKVRKSCARQVSSRCMGHGHSSAFACAGGRLSHKPLWYCNCQPRIFCVIGRFFPPNNAVSSLKHTRRCRPFWAKERISWSPERRLPARKLSSIASPDSFMRSIAWTGKFASNSQPAGIARRNIDCLVRSMTHWALS